MDKADYIRWKLNELVEIASLKRIQNDNIDYEKKEYLRLRKILDIIVS